MLLIVKIQLIDNVTYNTKCIHHLFGAMVTNGVNRDEEPPILLLKGRLLKYKNTTFSSALTAIIHIKVIYVTV